MIEGYSRERLRMKASFQNICRTNQEADDQKLCLDILQRGRGT